MTRMGIAWEGMWGWGDGEWGKWMWWMVVVGGSWDGGCVGRGRMPEVSHVTTRRIVTREGAIALDGVLLCSASN